MPELMVQIDGETLPLGSCHWVLFDSKDCAQASSYGTQAVDAEAAHRHFRPRQRDRNRPGHRVELLTKDQWRDQAAPCFYGTCAHRKAAAK